LKKTKNMNTIKKGILAITLMISQIIFAQVSNDLMLYRKDFKSISGKNTVSVTSYEKDGSHYVYAGGVGNVDVYSLDKEGILTPISNHELHMKKGPARGMVADNINGTDFLFVANKHGNVIETFEILDNGSLVRVALVEDTDETHLGTAITLQVVHMKKASYLFIGGLEETPGLSSFKIQNDGKLTHVQSMKDDETIHTDGIIGMFIHKIKGKTFLYTGGFQDNGVSSFRVYENGKFKNVNNISDNTTDRYLTGAYPVTGATLGNNKYVIVGHRHHKYYKRGGSFIKRPNFVYHGDGVSVFKVNKKGALVPHFVLKDDETTKLQGQTRIEVVSTENNEAVLAVGTRDDASIQLLKLNKEGILSPINYLETGYSIYYGLKSHKIGDDNFLIAGSFRFDLKKIATYKISPKINRDGKILKHMVNLKYKEGTTEAQINMAVKTFINLKNEIPEIANIQWGVNDSTEGASKGFTHCFTLTFNNEHAREIYLFHKAHLVLINKIGPLIGDVFVMDYWTTK
jgi:6-phosphogluconolactonase (cycloisomerase 2 family)